MKSHSKLTPKYNPETTTALEEILNEGFDIDDAEIDTIINLLDRNANPNVSGYAIEDAEDNTLLHILLEKISNNTDAKEDQRYIILIQKLVSEYGANINLKNGVDDTPLKYFMDLNRGDWDQRRLREVALLLVKFGADPTTTDEDELTLGANFLEEKAFTSYNRLQKIIAENKSKEFNPETTARLKELLQLDPDNLKRKSDYKDMYLYDSLIQRMLAMLKRNADPNIVTYAHNATTVLHYILHLLKNELANLSVIASRDMSRQTYINVIEEIVSSYPADINIQNKLRETPLQTYMNLNKVGWHDYEISKHALTLVRLGANADVKNLNGKTLGELLLNAEANETYDQLQHILKARKAINVKDVQKSKVDSDYESEPELEDDEPKNVKAFTRKNKLSVGPKVFDKSATKAAHEIQTNKQTHHAVPRAKGPGQTG